MTEDYHASAPRHYRGAKCLAANNHLDIAGYLVGYAAECAIKAAIRNIHPAAKSPHLHLPDLIEVAKRALRGRTPGPMFTLLGQPDFMRGWQVALRYRPDGTTSASDLGRWQHDARRALAAAHLRRHS